MMGLLQAVSGTPLVAGRAFLPAFLFALFARIGVGALESPPDWFISDWALIILGVLALAEILADKVPEARELLHTVDVYIKPLMAFCLSIGAFGPEANKYLQPLVGDSDVVHMSSFGGGFAAVIQVFLAAISAAGTLFFVRSKNVVLGALIQNDQDDDSGIGGAFSWLTDISVGLGVVLFVFAPVIAFMLTGVALLVAFLVGRAAKAKEQKTGVTCGNCGHLNLSVALKCSKCCEANSVPKRLSMIGTATSSVPIADIEQHRFNLMQWKRCPDCGTVLRKKAFSQECSECSRQVFQNTAEAQQYLANVEAKMPQVVLISGLLGLIPILGLVAGVLYYRWGLIPGLRRYLTRTETFTGRWAVRLINFFILWFQVIPLIGALTLPAMCLTNFFYYRRLFRRHLSTLESRPPMLPSRGSSNQSVPSHASPDPGIAFEVSPNPDTFVFECGSCHGGISATLDFQGTESSCPHCGNGLVVPAGV